LGIEVYSEKNRLEYTLYLNKDGVIEFKPAQARGLSISACQVEYGIVPSFIGTDFVYDPRKYGGRDHLYIPSMNSHIGLVDGEDCMMVGVWPPANQVVRVGLKGIGDKRIIDGFSIDMANRSFYLSYLEHPDIWHAEVLKDTYLEKDTVIGWRRPFDAKWIGRFFIKSEGIDYPFYFKRKREKIWGRCIRGWYYYPLWFDGGNSYVHFEKKFPPEGKAVIYFLEKVALQHASPTEEKNVTDIFSPVEVMQKALGEELAVELLDFDGIECRILLRHKKAVCAMTDKLQEIFEYSRFANKMKEFLEARRQADPELAGALRPIGQTLNEMQEARESGMPSASINDVRRWTDQIKQLTNKVRKENSEQCKALGHKCRKVAAAQDDLTRDLAILTIRLMEEAAELAVESPKRVTLAQEIIAKARQTLRDPTCMEPRRDYELKPDPGA